MTPVSAARKPSGRRLPFPAATGPASAGPYPPEAQMAAKRVPSA